MIAADITPLYVVCGYIVLLLVLGVVVNRFFRGTSSDYYVATRSIGPFLLLMSLFGTTMTAFALVGSTGKAFEKGIGVYGLMASSSGIVHSLVFFLVGIKLWAIGKRYNYVTQIQFFRARFQSTAFGYLLFPILVGLVIPYLLIGILGAGSVMQGVTEGMFPNTFDGGSVPPWLSGLVVSCVVLFYIFLGGLRGAAWANAMQTMVFMGTGMLAFVLISNKLGGLSAATEAVFSRTETGTPNRMAREGLMTWGQFLTYGLVPLSIGMFPHLFQHWLTAKSAKAFRLSIVAHPIFIMIVWVPCVLIGVWAFGAGHTPGLREEGGVPPNAILSVMVASLENPYVMGLLTAGILAAIMSSLDSQFVCLGTMFTHDIVLHRAGPHRYDDRQQVFIGRCFIVSIVAVTYLLSLLATPNIFNLAVWSFSGFASLFPIVFAALYWRRVTAAGAIAATLVMAGTWIYFFYQGLIGPIMEGTHKKGHEFLIGGMMPVAVIFAATAVTLVLVSLVTKPPSDDYVDRFFMRRRT